MTMAKKKLDCFACSIPFMSGTAHAPTCKKGAAKNIKRGAKLVMEMAKDIEEEWTSDCEAYDLHEMHEVLVNLLVLADAQAKRIKAYETKETK
jgi:hypothetical protein